MSAGRENRLAAETSPYLLQHAHNPVDWYPWGEESDRESAPRGQAHPPLHRLLRLPLVPRDGEGVFRERRHRGADERALRLDQGRPGGAARRRPDLHERGADHDRPGGWPMSVFLTPELQPFYGGTYFPPEDRWGRPGFSTVLRESRGSSRRSRPGAGDVESVDRATQSLASTPASRELLTRSLIHAAARELARRFDPRRAASVARPSFLLRAQSRSCFATMPRAATRTTSPWWSNARQDGRGRHL